MLWEYLVRLIYFLLDHLLLLPLPLHPSLHPKRELHLGNGNEQQNKVLQFAPKTHPKTCTQNLTLKSAKSCGHHFSIVPLNFRRKSNMYLVKEEKVQKII